MLFCGHALYALAICIVDVRQPLNIRSAAFKAGNCDDNGTLVPASTAAAENFINH